MNTYDPASIEKKWQTLWEDKKSFAANDSDATRPKWYSLIEFPYPSGAGMHIGHIRSNTAMDIVSRKRRMEGFNVLYPMGWDAFGLPTENYAIKTGISPQDATKQNTDTFRRQLKAMGFSFDWDREVNTTDPNYYKWTQWIFQQLFKRGLAYKALVPINWCPKDKTGLANEEVIQGKCERCGTPVEQRTKEQWMLKITAYADKLLAGLKDLDYLPEIKAQQENWIGRSEGAEIDFPVIWESLAEGFTSFTALPKEAFDKKTELINALLRGFPRSTPRIKVFTTRPDTLFGATYVVLAPDHQVLASLRAQITNWSEVEQYVAATKLRSDLDRATDDKEKTGVELKGIKVINPATKEEIPVWISDFVLATYGTGAIMAVPAHDQRDFEFARKFGLAVKEVVEPVVIQTSNSDAVQTDLPFQERNVAMVIVKHWSEDKYLCLRWKSNGWQGFVTGGIEKGEDAKTAALRELEEETGYLSGKFIKQADTLVHGKFYHGLKKVNRFAHFRGVYVELENGNRKEVADEEKAIHEIHWLSMSETVKFINRDDVRWVLQRLVAKAACSSSGMLVNSGKFSGMESEAAKKAITEFVGGKMVVKYKLRDWVFSRQRYWGEPIPLVYCPACAKTSAGKENRAENPSLTNNHSLPTTHSPGWFCVPEKDLPVILPTVEKYQPTDTGESPLSKVEEWVHATCPHCGGPARRETDTMPNWAGSSWYYLAYLMSKNAFKNSVSLEAWNSELSNFQQWMPVDWYNGGMEHVTLHLLYSRFWNLFLNDLGLVPAKEPYKKRTAHGTILGSDGVKMSKSRGNTVDPEVLIKEFGADALRLYIMFIAPFNQTVAWDPHGILGCSRFLEKIWKIGTTTTFSLSQESQNVVLRRILHQTIKKVSADIESMSFNTAISAMMILGNEMVGAASRITRDEFLSFLKILSTFAPHIAEELYSRVAPGAPTLLSQQPWPKPDETLATEDSFDLVIQVNGRVRAKISVKKGVTQAEAEKLALTNLDVKKWLTASPTRVIFVADRLINLIV